MLVKVETRHNGDTRTPRKYRAKKNLSANMSACEDTDKETHKQERPDERRLGGARKEVPLSLCAYTLTLDRHVDSVLCRRYRPQNVRGGGGGGRKNAGWKLVIRNALNSWSTIFDLRERAYASLPNIAR